MTDKHLGDLDIGTLLELAAERLAGTRERYVVGPRSITRIDDHVAGCDVVPTRRAAVVAGDATPNQEV